MTLDFPTFLIAAVFASQILVCSFFSAWRFATLERLVREKYPAEEYPRLYPIAPERMHRQYQVRMALRLLIGVTALAVLVAGLWRGIGAGPLAKYMIWICLAQTLPTLLFLPQQLRLAKTLREMPAPAIRSAELRPWRVVDLVSPIWIRLGIMASVLSLACVTYYFFQNPDALPLHGLCFVMNAWLLARMLYVLTRPVVMARPDPYMSTEDVFRARQRRLRLLFRGATVMGAYCAFMEVYSAGRLRFDVIYLAAGVSVLCQVLALLMGRMVKNAITERDLSPYRADPAKQSV
jgi:hypothetical protein